MHGSLFSTYFVEEKILVQPIQYNYFSKSLEISIKRIYS